MQPKQTWSASNALSVAMDKILLIIRSFSQKERKIFACLMLIAFVSGLGIISYINHSFMVAIPLSGGTFTEGIVGTPRFVNPVLAVSDADKDLTALVYSGLLRKGNGGVLIPDLAEKYELSKNGLEYVFTLKPNLVWMDGQPFTADDVVFTIQKIQDPSIHSPKAVSWGGVTVQKIDDRTVTFTLKEPYAPFIENTTVGIVPKHIWEGLTTDQWGYSSYNVQPVGTGPYQVTKVRQNSYGIPEYYDLAPFAHFALGKPYLSGITIKFYASDAALLDGYKAGEVNGFAALSPEVASELQSSGTRIERSPLPRVFSVFLNQTNQTLFTSKTVRSALNTGTDKDRIIDQVLLGYAAKADGPIPHGVMGSEKDGSTDQQKADEKERIAAAQKILQKDGWVLNQKTHIMEKTVKKTTQTLSFSLATSNADELKAIAEILKEDWERIGAKVEVKVYEVGDLNQNVIRTRKYDALLFGEIIGNDPDPYAFWHSSQRFDPGLNIALYANVTTDKLLEKAREAPDRDERIKLYQQFQAEVERDIPAIFLYSPDFLYTLPQNVQGVSLQNLTVSSDRFANIYKWYAKTQEVWRPFANIQ